MDQILTPLGDGVEGLFLKENRFCTSLITFNFYLPLKEETAAGYALLPFLLTTCSRDYPDFSKLNYKLSKLYGAQLGAVAEKVGDLQLLKISISTIEDRYALDGEALTEQACSLLLDLIFSPRVENEAFFEEDTEREKRKAIEHIRGEISDKRLYARKRLLEEMYADSAFGVPKCGSEPAVAALTGASLYKAWRQMLQSAFVRVNVIAPTLPNGLFEQIREQFASVERADITDRFAHTPTAPAKEVRHVTERMDVTQGKLAMGFSTEMYGPDEASLPMVVTCDLFGGGPYSRLFANVREKMSLCYYCSASGTRIKGLMTVDSGVEQQNADRAEQEILNQLEALKKGEFSDFEFESSIKSMTDSLKSAADSQSALDTWYSLRIANESIVSPKELAEKIGTVSKEDVIRAANGIRLHTVYRLLPKIGEKEAE